MKGIFNHLAVVGFAFCGLVCFTADAQNLIQNGSFESTEASGYYGQPFGWDGYGGVGVIAIPTDNPFHPQNAEEGSDYVFIADDSYISQTVDILTAGTYTLTWYDNGGGYVAGGIPEFTPTEAYWVTTNGPAIYGGIPPNIIASYSAYVGEWTERSLSLSLEAGPTTFEFDVSDIDFIDNVSLESVQTVPDSIITFAALAFTVGGLILMHRRAGKHCVLPRNR